MTALVYIDRDELACRIIDAYHDVRRPPGLVAAEAVAQMSPDEVERWQRVAEAVVAYFTECTASPRTEVVPERVN